MESRWRKHSNEVIAEVVAENPGLSEHELRKKLSAAYPFGMRKYHPYHIWLSAIDRHFNPHEIERKPKISPANEGQLALDMQQEQSQ